VYVIDASRRVARRVRVSTGRLVGESVEVTSGIAIGQQVVTEGAEYLRDGSAVDVLTSG
jgi:multidrug efflux pump subunit AcrA (membrane-fusion protein)